MDTPQKEVDSEIKTLEQCDPTNCDKYDELGAKLSDMQSTLTNLNQIRDDINE